MAAFVAPTERLHPARRVRLGGLALILAALAVMVVTLVSSSGHEGFGGVAAWVVAVAVLLLGGSRAALLPYLEFDASRVTLGNPFVRRTIAWGDVSEVVPGRRLGFRLKDGRIAEAWAIQRMSPATDGLTSVDRLARMFEEHRPVPGYASSTAVTTNKIEIPWPELTLLVGYAAALSSDIFT